MAKVTIRINAVDTDGKKETTNITYVNPEATNEEMKELAVKLNQLTTSTYTGTTKITEEDIT